MSKLIKKMQMDALSQSLGETRDMVLLNMSGVRGKDENAMRLALRKKNVRLQLVKNALAKRVLKDKGFAAKVDREEVYKGAELLGIDLNEHIDFIIEVLKKNRAELGI